MAGLKLLRMHIAALAMCFVLCLAPSAKAASLNQAGLIIDYGDSSTSWVWVPFEGEDLSVLDLLEQSDLDVVTVGFGGMGEAVCQIGPVGCSVDDCRRKLCQTNGSSPFWRLMILDGDEWRMGASGVSGTKVGDGDIVALSWSGSDPVLPTISFDDLATNAGADRESTKVATRTEGQEEDSESIVSWLPAIGAFGLVAVAAGALVYRAKSGPQEAA